MVLGIYVQQIKRMKRRHYLWTSLGNVNINLGQRAEEETIVSFTFNTKLRRENLEFGLRVMGIQLGLFRLCVQRQRRRRRIP